MEEVNQKQNPRLVGGFSIRVIRTQFALFASSTRYRHVLDTMLSFSSTRITRTPLVAREL